VAYGIVVGSVCGGIMWRMEFRKQRKANVTKNA